MGKGTIKQILLVVISLLFYAWGGIGYAIFLLLYALLVYGLGCYIDHAQETKRAVRLTESVVLLVAILFYVKYYGFFLDNLFGLLSISIQYETLSMPLGISFITFTAIAYLVDIRRETISAANVLDVAVYVTFFPKLIMGPIERYDHWQKQTKLPWDKTILEEGAIRFLMGLSQKLLLADALAPLWSYGSTHVVSLSSAWMSLLAYTFQIYFDFQGYMNMAIGLGLLFGFRLCENFDHPYMAISITDFWRRWHMSLGSWFRDYIYIPLGGNRKKTLYTLRNLLIVWGLTGIWHGASWNFLLWGLYYGGFLILEKFVLRKWLEHLPSFVRWLFTFVVVMLGWVLFASHDMDTALSFYRQLFLPDHGWWDMKTIALLANEGVLLIVAALCCSPVPAKLYAGLSAALQKQGWFLKPILTFVWLMILFSYLLSSGYQSFLYVQF